MIFAETDLKGAYIIEMEMRRDARGFFARSWCQREFHGIGLNPRLVQCSVSFSKSKGTLRGLHYQAAPHEEAKVVRCTRGAIHDVILDLRSESPTFKKHLALELTADNRRMLYVPEGFAHGFQTLAGDTEVFYQMSEFFAPECARGIRWNDPSFAITWPISHPIMNERDRNYPDFVV